jgi:hypothetical protein
MIKKPLLILMAFASLTIANTARAGLGWSLSECQDHYRDSRQGKPINEEGAKNTFSGLMIIISPFGFSMTRYHVSTIKEWMAV